MKTFPKKCVHSCGQPLCSVSVSSPCFQSLICLCHKRRHQQGNLRGTKSTLTITLDRVRPGADTNESIGEHFCPLVAAVEGVDGVVAKLAAHHLSITLSEAVITDGHPLFGGAIVDVQETITVGVRDD